MDENNLHPAAVVGYFYFDFRSTEKQKSYLAIRSLLFQLALNMPECLQALEQCYQRCNNGHNQPCEDTVRSMLCDALALPRRVYIVLDALDECTDQEILLPFLHRLMLSQPQQFCLLATSRPEKDIEEQIIPLANHVVNIQSTEVDHDIRVYAHDRLTTDIKLKKWPSHVKSKIAHELMSKANGMYVKLSLRSLTFTDA